MNNMVSKKQKLVEVARSFSFKLNLGDFQNADFFCSQKVEVPEEEAEKYSELLYKFCRQEVLKSVNLFLDEKKMKLLTDEEIKKIDDDWQKKYEEASQLAELNREDKEAKEQIPIIEK